MSHKIKINSLKNKSRRLRKKLYLGEFAVTGFELHFTFSAIDAEDYDRILNAFIEQVESRHLCIGGGADKQGNAAFFVVPFSSVGKATEEDRATLTAWLKAQHSISNVQVGQLVDANYGPF